MRKQACLACLILLTQSIIHGCAQAAPVTYKTTETRLGTFDYSIGPDSWCTTTENGCHLAYAIERKKKWYAVIDGKASQPYDALDGYPIFNTGGL